MKCIVHMYVQCTTANMYIIPYIPQIHNNNLKLAKGLPQWRYSAYVGKLKM